MAEKTITAYDPEREALVDVPASAEKQLADAGYKVGPLAEIEAREQGWEGKLATALLGVSRRTSFGVSDALIPQSLWTTKKHVEAMHPVIKGVAEAVGDIPRVMAGPAANILGSGIEGGIEAATEASKMNHPLTAEHIVQGALWEGALATLGEGVGHAIKGVAPAGVKILGKLAKAFPREASTFVAEPAVEGAFSPSMKASMARGVGDEFNSLLDSDGKALQDLARAQQSEPAHEMIDKIYPGYQELRAKYARTMTLPETFESAPAKVTEVPGKYKSFELPDELKFAAGAGAMHHLPLVGAALAANKVIPKALNNLGAINRGFEKIVKPVANALGDTVRLLTSEGAAHQTMTHIKDAEDEYDRLTKLVGQAHSDPLGLQEKLDARYGDAFEEYPQAYAGATQRMHTGLQIAHSLIPKDPNPPNIASTFNPPLSMKLKWLQLFKGIQDPSQGLLNPYPELIEVYKQVHPETLNMARQQILSALQDPKFAKNLSTAQARKLSIILEMPVRRETNQQFLARLQETALEAQKPQTSTGAPKAPASAQNQAAQMYAPPMLQNQLIGQ